jgi:SAM-dependent methyltransferase
MKAVSIVGRTDGRTRQAGAADELRARLHRQWADVAPGWAKNADYVDALVAPVTEKLLELSAPQPGERVLELACGPGGVGLVAAERVAPHGEVILSDVTAEMIAIAAARARARGLDNVTTRELDLERIEQPDDSYDVVLCREGLMFALDPAHAAREIRRILRPAGRVALSVWGPRERNPWLGVVLDAVSAQTGAPTPPPGVPCPFSLGNPERLAGLLSDAGLSEVTVTELPMTVREASFEDWWERRAALAEPLARVLASLPEDALQALRSRARDAIDAYETPTGLEFPAVTLLASGRRAWAKRRSKSSGHR